MKFHGSQVPDPSKAFGPYDLEPIHDRCINCEARKKIVAIRTKAGYKGKDTEPLSMRGKDTSKKS